LPRSKVFLFNPKSNKNKNKKPKEHTGLPHDVTPHTPVIPAKAGIQIFFVNKGRVWIPDQVGNDRKE